MDVAFVSKFDGDQLVFRNLEGDAESFGWREGESFPIDESYCKRVLDGRISPRQRPIYCNRTATTKTVAAGPCFPMPARSLPAQHHPHLAVHGNVAQGVLYPITDILRTDIL
jgi:hypothetical protein